MSASIRVPRALFAKDLRLAGGILVAALVTLATIALLEFGWPLVAPAAMRSIRFADAVMFVCTLAFTVVPTLVAVSLCISDSYRGGELLTATLPVPTGARWRSKLLVAALAYVLFAALASLSWIATPPPFGGVPDVQFARWLFAISALGVIWGFGAVGFTRYVTGAYLLAVLLPLFAFGALLFVWIGLRAPCRSLLWSVLGFDPTLSPSMTVLDDGGEFMIRRFMRLAELPMTISIIVSLTVAGLWTAWRARAFIDGRHTASRRSWRGIAALAVLLALLGVASAVVTTVAAQYRIGFDMAANRNLQIGYQRGMAMSPEQLVLASVEVHRDWPCEDLLRGQPFAWSDRFVAVYDAMRGEEAVWQPHTRFADPDWLVRHGMTIALRTRLLTQPDRASLLDAIERAATDPAGLHFTQRLDLAMLADEFSSDAALIVMATDALVAQRDACEVLAAMEALAVRGGVMHGFARATCECRVRAYERLRSIRGEMPTGPGGTRWAGRLQAESVDQAMSVLAAPMAFLREPLDAALARDDRSRGPTQFPERRANMLECLDCDISTLIDAEGVRQK